MGAVYCALAKYQVNFDVERPMLKPVLTYILHLWLTLNQWLSIRMR
jgi:hypothetical protein